MLFFVRETGHPYPSHWINGDISPNDENKPVIQVSWYDCQILCRMDWEKAAN